MLFWIFLRLLLLANVVAADAHKSRKITYAIKCEMHVTSYILHLQQNKELAFQLQRTHLL